ncbi:tricarboxylate transport membrane protein TctA [Vibrio variabilis]|uniref:Tricarboxylate transport membrane protein TctA n=1 Tax=Vibrio variabilis TaxID=990271 RepID=A0ABQ0JPU3_9VIBR|nr:tricarboxylate transport membrane protein TctA [Vibrio variabilis]
MLVQISLRLSHMAKRKVMSKTPEKFGTGVPEAISAPEAANNGVTGGALIPMLTLGVPGDAVAAIMIGALTVQGLQPVHYCSRTTQRPSTLSLSDYLLPMSACWCLVSIA